MAQKKIPTAAEVREYLEERKSRLQVRLWDAIDYLIEKEDNKGKTLLRNMKVLERSRPFLTPMKKKLEEA